MVLTESICRIACREERRVSFRSQRQQPLDGGRLQQFPYRVVLLVLASLHERIMASICSILLHFSNDGGGGGMGTPIGERDLRGESELMCLLVINIGFRFERIRSV